MSFSIPFVLLALVVSEQGPGTITRAELIQGIRDSEDSLKNLSVSCAYKIQKRSLKGDVFLPDMFKHAVYTVDASGRIRSESFGDLRDSRNAKSYRVRRIGVFDGKRSKAMEGDDIRFVSGQVSEQVAIPDFIDPRDYIYNYFGMSVSKTLEQEGSRIVGPAQWDGHQVLVVEWIKEHPDGEKGRRQFLVDCRRGFAVVRRSTSMLRSGDKDWIEIDFREGSGYAEVAPGIWLPAAVKWEWFGVPVDPATKKAPLFARYEIKNSNWVLNASLPDSIFSLEFPPAIMITDDQTGKVYQTVEMVDGNIVREVAAGLELYTEKRQWFTLKTALIWGSLSVAFVALLFAWIRRSWMGHANLRKNST